MQSQKGFTLIELLVVVAIIGILTSVALASLNGARVKGNDAAIKDAMANFRSQSEVLSDSWTISATVGIYGSPISSGTCPSPAAAGAATNIFDHPTANKIIVNAATNANKLPITTATNVRCSLDASGNFLLAVPLRSSGVWCVDSSGNTGLATGGTLPAAGVYVCP